MHSKSHSCKRQFSLFFELLHAQNSWSMCTLCPTGLSVALIISITCHGYINVRDHVRPWRWSQETRHVWWPGPSVTWCSGTLRQHLQILRLLSRMMRRARARIYGSVGIDWLLQWMFVLCFVSDWASCWYVCHRFTFISCFVALHCPVFSFVYVYMCIYVVCVYMYACNPYIHT